MKETFIKLEDINGEIINKTVQDLIGQKIAIHCDTEEKANELLKKLDSEGVRWTSGTSTVDTSYFNVENENTSYMLTTGGLQYSPIYDYESEGCKIYRYVLDESIKFKKGDKVKVVNIETKEVYIAPSMKRMLCDTFTIKSNPREGRCRVEENDWTWGQSNLELVEDKPVAKVLKVWELEEGKEYHELIAHTENTKFRMYNGELQYKHRADWTRETNVTNLREILSYEFIEIKSQVERDIDKLIEKYGKEEVKRAIQRIRIGDGE